MSVHSFTRAMNSERERRQKLVQWLSHFLSIFKGAVCKIHRDLLSEINYGIHTYVFISV